MFVFLHRKERIKLAIELEQNTETLPNQGSISHPEDGILVILAIVNTALGTSAAGVFTLIFNKTGIVPGTGGNYSFLDTMNGSLTGNYLNFNW